MFSLIPKRRYVFLCVEFGWQWLDQQHVHLPCLGNGEHQLLHRWHHQPQLGTTEGGRPRRDRWVKQTHPSSLCFSAGLHYSCTNAVVLIFFVSGCRSFPRFPRCLCQTLFFCGIWAAWWLSDTLPGQGRLCVCVCPFWQYFLAGSNNFWQLVLTCCCCFYFVFFFY